MANGGNLFVESGVPEDVMENLARRGHSVAVSLEAATSVQPSMSLIIGIAFSAISVNLSTKYFVISSLCSLHS